MNTFLRNENRRALQPFLKYLKLLICALHKLPPFKGKKGKVCRGAKADITSKTLDNPMFLGKEGRRAVFFIECKSGRNISALSACPSEDEILLMPSTSFTVEHVVVTGDVTMVQLTEVEPLEDFADLFI
jgi:hypothetical protein